MIQPHGMPTQHVPSQQVPFTSRSVLALLLGLTTATVTNAQPQPQHQTDQVRWEFGVMASILETPWKGLSAQTTALPFVNAEVGNWRFGPKYGIAQYQISRDRVQYGLGVGYRDESYESDWIPGFKTSDAPELDGYKSGGGDLTLLASVRYQRLAFRLEQDISDNSNGLTAEAKIEHPLFGRGLGWNLKAHGGLYWQSEDYVQHLYGISGSNIDSAKGRMAYAPESALNPFVGINTSYIFDRQWGLHGFYRFERLDSPITDSPIVDEKNKQSLGMMLTYRM